MDKTRASRKFQIYDEYKFDYSKLRRTGRDTNSIKNAKRERRRGWLPNEPKVEMRSPVTSPKINSGAENNSDLRTARRRMHVYDNSQFDQNIARKAPSPISTYNYTRKATSPDRDIQEELRDSFPTMHVYDMEPYNLEGVDIF